MDPELEQYLKMRAKVIAKPYVEAYDYTPSEGLAQRIERITGDVADHDDNDWGNGERGSDPDG